MVYVEYEKLKKQYDYMVGITDQILKEKENLFCKTQPNAIQYDKVSVTGGKHENGFDDYLEECEKRKIDKRLNEAICILNARAELVRLKEQELRASKEPIDVIYCMKVLDNVKVPTIAMALNYSEMQIYRFLNKIKKG